MVFSVYPLKDCTPVVGTKHLDLRCSSKRGTSNIPRNFPGWSEFGSSSGSVKTVSYGMFFILYFPHNAIRTGLLSQSQRLYAFKSHGVGRALRRNESTYSPRCASQKSAFPPAQFELLPTSSKSKNRPIFRTRDSFRYLFFRRTMHRGQKLELRYVCLWKSDFF